MYSLSTIPSIGVRGDDQGWVHQTWDKHQSVVAGDMLGSAELAADRVSLRIGWGACQRHEVACRQLGQGHWRECPRETRQSTHRRHHSSLQVRER